MKHSGKAFRARCAHFLDAGAVARPVCRGSLATFVGGLIAAITSVFVTLWWCSPCSPLFFRDPNPLAPTLPNAIVSPAHGKVDVIDETTEVEFMGGPCKRISIFLSVIDVHVQKAPVTGQVVYQKRRDGKFLSATKADSAEHNECVLLGFVPTDYPDRKVGLRLIAGLIARRIIVWVETGETVQQRSHQPDSVRRAAILPLSPPAFTRNWAIKSKAANGRGFI
jgi:phosphatidylserine decarboxylase